MIERLNYTPPWLEQAKDKDKPVFLLRAGTILERDQFEAELEGRHRAGMVLSFQLMEAAISGVRTLVGSDEAAELIELVRADFGASGEPSDLSPKEKARVKSVADILAEHWPEYKALVEREARRTALLPTLAFVAWCDGWEKLKDSDGKPVEYARSERGEIDDALLRRIPAAQLRSAGLEAYALQYGRSQTKN